MDGKYPRDFQLKFLSHHQNRNTMKNNDVGGSEELIGMKVKSKFVCEKNSRLENISSIMRVGKIIYTSLTSNGYEE